MYFVTLDMLQDLSKNLMYTSSNLLNKKTIDVQKEKCGFTPFFIISNWLRRKIWIVLGPISFNFSGQNS